MNFKKYLNEVALIPKIYTPKNLGCISSEYLKIVKDDLFKINDEIYIYHETNRGKQQTLLLFNIKTKIIISRMKYDAFYKGFPLIKMTETAEPFLRKGYASMLYDYLVNKFGGIISSSSITMETYGMWKKLSGKYPDNMYLVFDTIESAQKYNFPQEFNKVNEFKVIDNSKFGIILDNK